MRQDKHKTSCGCDSIIQQFIELDIAQDQDISQENENVQLAAIAVALSGGLAKASQKSCQLNKNSQIGKAIAGNKVDFDNRETKATADVIQQAEVDLAQDQDVEQENQNIQLVTLAVADNSRSTAIANELNSQENKNTQKGTAIAKNNVGLDNEVEVMEDNQERRQINPAGTDSGELNRLRLSEQNFAVKVAFNHDGNIMEIAANDKGEVKVDEIKSTNVTANTAAVNAVNTVLVALDLDGDHLDISADQNGNVFVNGEKV